MHYLADNFICSARRFSERLQHVPTDWAFVGSALHNTDQEYSIGEVATAIGTADGLLNFCRWVEKCAREMNAKGYRRNTNMTGESIPP